MIKLPDSWSWSTLGDQCDLYQPKTISREKMITGGAYEVYGANGVIGMYNEYNHEDSEVLLSCRGNCGTVNVSKPKSWINGNAMVCKPKTPALLKNYLRFYLESINFTKVITGTAQQQITREPLSKVEIAMPPISEQHKIVELLEGLLSRLDAALAEIKDVKVKAAQFRRSFVHEMTTAIEGSDVMGILDICDVYQPKTISTKELIADGEFPVYGANGQIGFYDKFNHEDSEVTVTCRGATCGTVNVIPAMSWITGNAMVFRPKDSRIQKGFLEYVLRGMDWTPVITGTAQPQITRTSIQDMFVNVPSPEIQSEIYMKLEGSLTQVTNVELLSKKVEIQAANLRRSLLQAAFTGQLTKEVVSV
jgi:type I restriction enzyme S subunit